MAFVDEYSEELICMMLVALESEEIKRKKSDQLLKYLSEYIQHRYPSLQEAAEASPLARWAFDHMLPAGGRGDEGEGDDETATAAEQYFGMIDRFGWGGSRESSWVSSSVGSFAGSSSRGFELSSLSSLGETY